MTISVGDRFKNKRGQEYTVTAKRSFNDIDILFDDGTSVRHIANKEVKNGNIKNKNSITVLGVGKIGYGDFNAKLNGKNTKAYEVWRGILRRCYGKALDKVNKRYEEVSVDSEWLNFQNFAKWYYSQPNCNSDFHVDKDFLSKTGSKLYSENTCFLCPPVLNSLFTGAGIGHRGKYPIGVHFRKESGKFICQCRINGIQQNFGEFDNEIDAFEEYKTQKEMYVKIVAEKYKEVIPHEVYQFLMTYEVKITD